MTSDCVSDSSRSASRGLVLESVSAGYGGDDVVHDLDLVLQSGQVSFIVGPNGAGKTTLARALAGLVPLSSGRVTLDDLDLTSLSPPGRARSGLVLIPEGRQIFPKLTVHEQLYVASRTVPRRDRAAQIGHVYDLIPRLVPLRSRVGGTMSGGEQQLLAIGRALAGRPRFVILDEPTMGLSPGATDAVAGVIDDLRREGLGVLVMAQDLHLSSELGGSSTVMVGGRWQLKWDEGSVPNQEDLLAAYFGLSR